MALITRAPRGGGLAAVTFHASGADINPTVMELEMEPELRGASDSKQCSAAMHRCMQESSQTKMSPECLAVMSVSSPPCSTVNRCLLPDTLPF